jgi:hypothetical protein
VSIQQGPTWIYEGGSHVVYEIEHLFGFDVVLAVKADDGRPYPIGIITRQRAMSDWDMKFAREWLIAAESEQYGRAANCAQTLSEQ